MIANKALVTLAFLAICTAAGAGYLLKESYVEQGIISAKLETTQLALNSYVVAVDQLSKDQVTITAKNVVLQTNFSKTSRELIGLKNREATVLKKKGLVELKINKAFNKQQLRLSCITGDTTACGS